MKKILILSFLIISSLTTIFAQCMEASSDEGVSVVGFMQPQFEYKQIDDADGYVGFAFNRARLGVVGNIPYDFSYYLMIEFSPFASVDGVPYLLDGFATYSRLAPYAKISMGQFKSPFSLELNTACQSLHTIKRSLVVRTLASPDRDLGILIQGNYDMAEYAKFKYALAFTNGNGIGVEENIGAKDDNQNKVIAARLVYSPMDMFNIGGSYRVGTYYNSNTPETEDERSRIAGEIQFEGFDFLVQAEYIQSEDKGSYTTGGG